MDWLLKLPCIKGEVVGCEESRRARVRSLDKDFRLLLLALKAVFYRKKLAQQLVPEAFNEDGWLAEFLDLLFEALQKLEDWLATTRRGTRANAFPFVQK